MAEPPFEEERAASRLMFDRAKTQWGSSVLLRLVVFFAGVAVLFLPEWARVAAWMAAGASVLAEVLSILSDRQKSTADWLLRQLDFAEGFGWPLPASELSEIRVRSEKLFARAKQSAPTSVYFDTAPLRGDRGAVCKVFESAWWSHHLARRMAVAYGLAFGALILLALLILLVTAEAARDRASINVAARVAVGIFVLAFSAPVARQWYGYVTFQEGARGMLSKSEALLGTAQITERDSLLLMTDYHLRRSGAPLIPTFMYSIAEKQLRSEWRRRAEAAGCLPIEQIV